MSLIRWEPFAGVDDLIATSVTIFAVAVGVLCGALLLQARAASHRAIGTISHAPVVRTSRRRMRGWFRRSDHEDRSAR